MPSISQDTAAQRRVDRAKPARRSRVDLIAHHHIELARVRASVLAIPEQPRRRG